MKVYIVELPIIGYYTTKVIAEDEKMAIDKAIEKFENSGENGVIEDLDNIEVTEISKD